MNWNERAQDMMECWTETQKKPWESWGGGASGAAAARNGPWTGWLSPWQEMARETLRTLTGGVEGVPREVAERMFAGEKTYLRFVDLSLDAFKNVAPKIEAGEDWGEMLRRYLQQVRTQSMQPPTPWVTPEAAAAAAGDMQELWRLYLTQMKDLGLPWVRSVQEAHGHLGEAMSGDRQVSIKMYNLFLDTFENTLGKFAAGPAIGYTRESQEKVTKAFEAWVDVRRAEVEFQTEIANTGFRVLEALARELIEKAGQGEKITKFRDLFDLWVATAEDTYYETASTESFAAIQARLVNAAMRYKIREREVAEEFLRAMHLPTRRELDDAYRHMHDLRNEVKTLRKEMRHLRDRVIAAEATSVEKAPTQKRPARATSKNIGTKSARVKTTSASRTGAEKSENEG